MRRRAFLAVFAGAAALGLRVAPAQQAEKVRRIGVLMGMLDSPGALGTHKYADAFVEELARLGWVDGRNAAIEILWTNADINRANALAKQLAASQPDVFGWLDHAGDGGA
jgi:putative tryptophan/tyrosine transport system substrate-binding protein